MQPGLRFVLVIASALWCLASAQFIEYSGSMKITGPGALHMYTHDTTEPTLKYSVLTSTYDLTANSYDDALVIIYPGTGGGTNYTGLTVALISNIQRWSTGINQVPSDIFNFAALSLTDGSLIDGKTSGTVSISNVDDMEFPATYDIIKDDPPLNFMYHDVVWKQVDNSGRLDIITCRVDYDSDNDTLNTAQLLSLVNPEFPFDPLTTPWPDTVLKEDACDTHLADAVLQAGVQAYDVIYTTGFHTHKLAFFWPQYPTGGWSPATVQGAVIETGRQYYDVQIADINNDGNAEVIVTVVSNTDGSVEVWEIPADFRDSVSYQKHVLVSGFAARHNGVDGRSPGIIRVFWPSGVTTVKPYLFLTGGDDGRAYYLMPLSEDPLDWTYDIVTITDRGEEEAIGGGTVADIDGDGYTEVIISSHNEDLIEFFTFRPADG